MGQYLKFLQNGILKWTNKLDKILTQSLSLQIDHPNMCQILWTHLFLKSNKVMQVVVIETLMIPALLG